MDGILNNIDLISLYSFLQPGIFAILVLIIGIIVAKIISSLLYKGLNKAHFVSNMFAKIGANVNMETIAKLVSKIVFYIIILFTLVAFFERIGLDAVNEPIDSFIKKGLPGALGALGLAVFAWVIAFVSKFLVIKTGKTFHVDDKLSESTESKTHVMDAVGNVLYWFILLFFTPAILAALGQEELLLPITDVINQIIGYVPNIIAAGVVFFIGWFIAKILRKITTNLLLSMKIDNAMEKFGLKNFSIAKILGTFVYFIILVPIVIEALNRLEVEAISGPATQMLHTIVDALPGIFAAAVIITIAYIIAKFISQLITELFHGIGFDKILNTIGLHNVESNTKPSVIVGKISFIYILILAIIEAANKIGFGNLSGILETFIVFTSNVILGIVILGIGMYLANLAGKAIRATTKSSFLPMIAKAAILVLTTAMGLKQMGIADDIINLAFGLTLGAFAFGTALAIGLGAKDIAGEETKKLIMKIKK